MDLFSFIDFASYWPTPATPEDVEIPINADGGGGSGSGSGQCVVA
jgi:hypothetical protein